MQHGSSSTKAGVRRQNAVGNTPKSADFELMAAEQPDLQLVSGKVLIWDREPKDINTVKQNKTKQMPAHPTIAPVLQVLGVALPKIIGSSLIESF